MKKLYFFWLIFLAITTLSPDVKGQQSISVSKINSIPVIDGKLDDEFWNHLPVYQNFIQQFPLDSIPAKGDTRLQFAFDDENLYVGIYCITSGSEFITTSLKRDYSFRFQDNITIVLDTYADNNNAFSFGINSMGVTREALISNGGREREDFQRSWDNKWNGEAFQGDHFWSAEMAIPFKTLRYTSDRSTWLISSYRNDTQLNEQSTLGGIPRNRIIMDLGFGVPMNWSENLPEPGSNISLIPYVIAGTSRDFEDIDQVTPERNYNVGGDAKIGVTSGLNLDLTLNPDFSQVEVDEQVTNLDRFEILFPEKRQFFLENSDLFGSFGLSRVNPFFTRRIGVAVDTTTGQNIQNPIIYGARLSGKVNDNLRVGILNMQTAAENDNGLPPFNYSVAALQHQVFGRSNISFIMVNKQAVRANEFEGEFNRYNRLTGLEYRLNSKNNFWRGKTFYHRVFSPIIEEHPFAHGTQIEYIQRRYRLEWAHNIVGNGFNAEVGFVPRKDYLLISPEFQLFFYPNTNFLNTHQINIDTRWFYQLGKSDNTIVEPMDVSEQQVELQWEFNFTDNSQFNISGNRTNLLLLRDFDPTRIQSDTVYLAAGTEYTFSDISFRYFSDQRRLLGFSLQPSFGQFYSGNRWGISGNLTYRIQPYGSIGGSFNYNDIRLPYPFLPARIWLLGPKIDLTFTKSIFFTAFFQYNNQLDNMNINARFQWRFAPVSDFFIVYTDNYFTAYGFDDIQKRNRALVAKLTYWLNL